MPASLRLTDNPVYLKFFQDCARARHDKPIVLEFPSRKEAEASRAALNAFRSKLAAAKSDFYEAIKVVVLRIADNPPRIIGAPRHVAPLDEALAKAGYSVEDLDTEAEPAGSPVDDSDWLRNLMEG